MHDYVVHLAFQLSQGQKLKQTMVDEENKRNLKKTAEKKKTAKKKRGET